MLSEISQREKDKYCVISLIGGHWKKKTKTNKKYKLIDKENRLMLWEGKWEGLVLREMGESVILILISFLQIL